MKLLVAIGVLLCIIAIHTLPTTKTICEDEKITCFQTEYSAYVKCVEKQRVKRQACLFADSMQPRAVQPAQTGLLQPQMIQTVHPPCLAGKCNPVPNSQIVIDTCMNSCGNTCSGSSCRERCDVSCQNPQPPPLQPPQPTQIIPKIHESIKIIEKSGPAQHHSVSTPNVTTIIKLTNIINNTNLVNVPTSINNTNVNNIDIVTNSSNVPEKCCTVVQPKVCSNVHSIMNRTVYRCIHKRHNTCGEQCTSNTMHAQVRQPCNGTEENCPSTISYVPQPDPKCTYQQTWPYVRCGGTKNPECEGCYDHYGYGFQQYHGAEQPECSGCFDDGFGAGSLYRQGPFYRPGYYHTPPCYMMGTCGVVQQPMVQHVDCGLGGCFGHELIDPSFGMQAYSPYSSYYQMMTPMPAYLQPYLGNDQYYILNGTSGVNENWQIEDNSNVLINPYSNELPMPLPFYGLPGFRFPPFNLPINHIHTNETVLVDNKK